MTGLGQDQSSVAPVGSFTFHTPEMTANINTLTTDVMRRVIDI